MTPAEAKTRRRALRLIVCDIEGCLSPGRGVPVTMAAIRAIREQNDRARAGVGLPLTLCSGRPQPFVEAVCQMLGVFKPCVCEYGAILYDPVADEVHLHPAVTDEQLTAMRDLKQRIATEVSRQIPLKIEAGKEICLSLNPVAPPADYPRAVPVLAERLRPFVDDRLFHLACSNSAVDITPRGMDKEVGVRFLAEVTGVPTSAMLGIGDTLADWPFLKLCGLAATVANGRDQLGDRVHYIATAPEAQGVVEILRWAEHKNGDFAK